MPHATCIIYKFYVMFFNSYTGNDSDMDPFGLNDSEELEDETCSSIASARKTNQTGKYNICTIDY